MRPKKGDIVLTALILLSALSLLIYFSRMPSSNLTAVISIDGDIKDRIVLNGLDKPVILSYENLGYINTVRAENGRICVESSDCPYQVCVHTGWISRPGQSIICMKTRLVIRIEGTGSDIDAVVG